MPEDATPPKPVLEPSARDFLSTLGNGGLPWGPDPAAARNAFAELQENPVDDPETEDEWLTLAVGPVAPVRVRVVRPVGSREERLPVILYLHGPGWGFGDARTHDRLVRQLALGADAAVVFPEYARPPEARYPVALLQAYGVAEWITAEGSAAALDGTRLAVAGDGAGGNLAAALTLLARQRGAVRPLCQVLLCPVTDAAQDTPSYDEFADGYVLGRDAMRRFWDLYTVDHAQRAEITASPLRATSGQLAGLPRALIVTAEADVLRDGGEAYAAGLRAAGGSATCVRYHGAPHGFMVLDSLRTTDAARAALIQTTDTLHMALHASAPRG
ncbi:alpha/beta hydrolase [Streptomyces sp. NPDC052023]|uniref:alpha/beta hydrolase n=1 Tax=Streptomyces sp. NPDC052023 TaxID=3365681 RepID=UPI0037D33855